MAPCMALLGGKVKSYLLPGTIRRRGDWELSGQRARSVSGMSGWESVGLFPGGWAVLLCGNSQEPPPHCWGVCSSDEKKELPPPAYPWSRILPVVQPCSEMAHPSARTDSLPVVGGGDCQALDLTPACLSVLLGDREE